eukprot:CAMPEP_0180257560 /NCGR_PEP_ID=MMETSP0987-20121128/41911_1 /TAXON_ID=697907 /ORGANISM="non described non described, Strain CCMP2293" /LENGTH=71 /DNA_ID=CAMNT_0022226927 /DNA_START=432 /DNA_END=647 /DNA_ORIENTATION=+
MCGRTNPEHLGHWGQTRAVSPALLYVNPVKSSTFTLYEQAVHLSLWISPWIAMTFLVPARCLVFLLEAGDG